MTKTAKAIRNIRKQNGLTQKEFGEILGISDVMVGQYERGVRRPKIEMLTKISKDFNTPLKDLLPDELASELEDQEFTKACEYLDEAGFTVVQDEKDFERNVYQINHFDRGTVAVESEEYILNLVQRIVEDSKAIQDNYIAKRLQIELLPGNK